MYTNNPWRQTDSTSSLGAAPDNVLAFVYFERFWHFVDRSKNSLRVRYDVGSRKSMTETKNATWRSCYRRPEPAQTSLFRLKQSFFIGFRHLSTRQFTAESVSAPLRVCAPVQNCKYVSDCWKFCHLYDCVSVCQRISVCIYCILYQNACPFRCVSQCQLQLFKTLLGNQ